MLFAFFTHLATPPTCPDYSMGTFKKKINKRGEEEESESFFHIFIGNWSEVDSLFPSSHRTAKVLFGRHFWVHRGAALLLHVMFNKKILLSI